MSAVPSSSIIASEQTFTTARTFLRIPHAAKAEGADVAFLGIPFDLATSNRPGARLGPGAIRGASGQLAELPAYPGGFDQRHRRKRLSLQSFPRHRSPPLALAEGWSMAPLMSVPDIAGTIACTANVTMSPVWPAGRR